METPKKFVIFQETKFSCASGSNFPSTLNKDNPFLKSFLYFGKCESMLIFLALRYFCYI